MKNVLLKWMLVLPMLIGATSINVYAGSRLQLPAVRLIEIKADYYPDETYYLGYAENPDHTINSIFYENHEHVRKFYSFKDLNNEVAIIQTTSGGTVYDLLRMKAKPLDESGNYEVTLSYMKNGLFRNRRSIEFDLIYNTQPQVYEVLDPISNQRISRALATTNYWGNIAVGIDRVIVSK